MCALNQNLNARKLSHFRYSLDELPQQILDKSILRRKNTLPQYSDQLNKEKAILQRLQKIGAHSYGGSMNDINQNENKYQNKIHSNSNKTIQGTVINLRSTVLVENDQYGMINKSSNFKNIEIREPCLKENIYERILDDSSTSSNSKEVSFSVPDRTNSSESVSKSNEMVLYEQQNCDVSDVVRSRPTTFLMENETYQGIQLNATENDIENKNRQTNLILENNHYYYVDQSIKSSNTNSEVIYAEPRCSADTDHNKNNLILNKIRGEENAYSITKLYNSNNSVNSIHYEELEKYGDYRNIKCQTESNEKSITKFKNNKIKKQTKNKTDDNGKQLKSKKSSNFIKRVWKKRRKYKEKEKYIEELYEAVTEASAVKLNLMDNTAVQMLSELQNILENKVPLLLVSL